MVNYFGPGSLLGIYGSIVELLINGLIQGMEWWAVRKEYFGGFTVELLGHPARVTMIQLMGRWADHIEYIQKVNNSGQ